MCYIRDRREVIYINCTSPKAYICKVCCKLKLLSLCGSSYQPMYIHFFYTYAGGSCVCEMVEDGRNEMEHVILVTKHKLLYWPIAIARLYIVSAVSSVAAGLTAGGMMVKCYWHCIITNPNPFSLTYQSLV